MWILEITYSHGVNINFRKVIYMTYVFSQKRYKFVLTLL
jgi:hypothetical protein